MLLVLLSSVALSFNGLIFRTMAEATAWQISFYRSGALAAAMFGLFLIRHRGRWRVELRRSRRSALIAGPMLGLAGICFLQSLGLTTVANTMFTLSAVPLFAAVFAWVVLAERIATATWMAILVAMAGIGLMVFDGFESGALLGNLLALATAVLFACFVVALRHGRHVDMLPAVAFGALISTAIGGVMAEHLDIALRDILICIAWGGLLSCFAHAIYTYASRHVLAAELTLLSLVEMIVSPLWVWLVFDETPNAYTLMGGAVVAVAIGGWALIPKVKSQSSSKESL